MIAPDRLISTEQDAMLRRDWPAGVGVHVMLANLNTLTGRVFTDVLDVAVAASKRKLRRPIPTAFVPWNHRLPAEKVRFSSARDALIRELRVTHQSRVEIHAAVSLLPGLPVSAHQVASRGIRLGVPRPDGYIDVEALQATGRNPNSLAALRRYHASRVKKEKPKPSTPRGQHPNSLAALLKSPNRNGQAASRKPKAVKREPRTPPVPAVTGSRGFVRLPFPDIRRVAEREGVSLSSPHDLQRFNEVRQRRGDPMLYVPLTDMGRPRV